MGPTDPSPLIESTIQGFRMVELASLAAVSASRGITHNYGDVRNVQYFHLFKVGEQVVVVRQAFFNIPIKTYPFG